jgi:serine/threonine protein kinase/WD40 repeat protein
MDADFLAARIQNELGSSFSDGRVPDRPPPRVADHELVSRIGGGSYGDVWLACSVTGQLRAVKVVWRQNFSSDRPYEREFRGIMQFEPISRSHPGVVNVLHVGRDDTARCFFYVMELADEANGGALSTEESGRSGAAGDRSVGCPASRAYAPRTLAADLRAKGRLPVPSVLALGVQLADALGHIHRHGLVHRDVKPSNVIFVESQAKLADIGLIAGVDEARSFVGTEGFIPPEGPGSVQADLFGLGRLLYEASTGKDRCEFPDLPDDLDLWSDRAALVELNEVLSRACAPNPKQRHANAAELAGDLNLLLSGRSIRKAYGIEKRLRRVTQVAVIAAAVALLAAGGAWFEKTQREGANKRARHEAELRGRAEQAEQYSRDQLRESLLQQARAFTGSSEPDSRARALDALRQAARLNPGVDLRNAALAALATPELRVVRRWNPRADGSANEVPDANLRRYARRNSDGTISILAVEDDAELIRLPRIRVPADSGGFSPDGAWHAVKYQDQELRAWHLAARTNLIAAKAALDFAFTPDSRRLIVVKPGAQLHAVELETSQVIWQSALSYSADHVAIHPSEPFLLVLKEGRNQIEIRNLTDGSLARSIPMPELGWIARWSQDGRQLITAHRDFSIRVWDWPGSESPRVILRFHRADPVWMATDPSGRWLATAAWDNQGSLFDLNDGRTILSRVGTSVHAAADRSAYLLANDNDWSLVEFDPAFALQTIPVHDEHKSPRDLAFSPDGRWLATAGQDGIRLFDRRRGEVTRLMTNEMSHRLTFETSSGRLLAITPNRLLAWRINADAVTDQLGLELDSLPSNGQHGFTNVDVSLTGLSSHGKWWLSVAPDPLTHRRAWVRGTFDSIDTDFLGAAIPNSHAPEFSPDGRWFAWGNWRDRDAHALALGTSEPPVRLPSVGSTSVAFCPNNRILAVGGSTEIQFLETGTWRLLHAIPREPKGQLPPSITFTTDSELCAVVLPPNRILLLNPLSGAPLATLPARSHFVVKAAFSPDQQTLAAVSTDHHLLIWDLQRLRAKLDELGLNW